MISLNLYIQGQRVDLFPDETVSITETIQNVRDVGKVFTDFTKTFNVPASSNNNILFKHYYNFNVLNSFDARVRVDANLEINLLPFKKGKLKLEGTVLKNNKISSYKVTFFGDTIEIKDKLREDKLNALDLKTYNLDYTTANIKAKLQANPAATDVICPLITHTERLTYNSTPTTETGNLHYTPATIRGVLWSELKFALRVDAIVRAIESKYDLNFSNDFFTSSNDAYYDLFMWCHRKKGDVEPASTSGNTEIPVDGWTDDLDPNTVTQMSDSNLNISGDDWYQNSNLILTTASATDYICTVYRDGVQVFSSGTVNGNQTFTATELGGLTSGVYSVFISSGANISFTSVNWDIEYAEQNEPVFNYSYDTGAYTSFNTFLFDFSQQIPEIKIIDFLTGLFKMFNLTAYFDKDTNEIIVDTLDNFYSGGVEYEVSKYVDVTQHEVNVALPYKQIDFGYEGLGTFLASTHDQLFNYDWGEENYNAGEDLDGEVYEVLLPFEHMKYERLIDGNGGALTDIQWGWFVDDNQDSYIDKPLLFYPIQQTSATPISFRDSTITNSQLITYNIPSNSVALSSGTDTANINFKNEINEYTFDTTFTGTLYNNYYSNYIEDVFNSQNRLSMYNLRLPLRIVLQLTLADRFVIYGNKYKINSITTNLTTLESKVELLNDFD